MIQEEFLLSKTVLQELCTESAKLKTLGAMEMIPSEKLTRLLNVLELNIRGGDRVSPISDVSLFVKLPSNAYVTEYSFRIPFSSFGQYKKILIFSMA